MDADIVLFQEAADMLFGKKQKEKAPETARSRGPLVRRAMRAEGRVQGVGFRYFVQSIARKYGLTGWVMNMPDGTVAMEAQGPEDRVDAFAKDITDQPDGWFIMVTGLKSRDIPQKADEASFVIRMYRRF